MEKINLSLWLSDIDNIRNWVLPIVGSLMLPLVLFHFGRLRKKFTYKIIGQEIDSTETREDETQYYIHKISIEYSNKGTEALEKKDFPLGINTTFLRGAIVHSAQLRNTEINENLALVNIKEYNSGAHLSPELFNPQDSCIVDYKIESYKKALYVSGKVRGQKGSIPNSAVTTYAHFYIPLFIMGLIFIIVYKPLGYVLFYNYALVISLIYFGILKTYNLVSQQAMKYTYNNIRFKN